MLSASLLIPPPLRPSNGKKRIAVRDCTCFVRRGGIRPPRAGGVCPDPAGILRRSFPTWVAAVFASGEPIRRAPGHARNRAEGVGADDRIEGMVAQGQRLGR